MIIQRFSFHSAQRKENLSLSPTKNGKRRKRLNKKLIQFIKSGTSMDAKHIVRISAPNSFLEYICVQCDSALFRRQKLAKSKSAESQSFSYQFPEFIVRIKVAGNVVWIEINVYTIILRKRISESLQKQYKVLSVWVGWRRERASSRTQIYAPRIYGAIFSLRDLPVTKTTPPRMRECIDTSK